MIIALSPRKLIAYLVKFYGESYRVSEETARKVLERCEDEFGDEYTEDELISVVEECLEVETVKDCTELKYFLGDKFIIDGNICEISLLDGEDGNSYFINGSWVNDEYLDSLIKC